MPYGGIASGDCARFRKSLGLTPNRLHHIFRIYSCTEHDVAAKPSSADQMVRASGQMGVPVIDVYGRVIVGFDKTGIERDLRRRSGVLGLPPRPLLP